MSIDWKIHTYATLPSTQQYVLELAEEGLPEGIVVQALTQSKGRGRHGRVWESPLGNLYMSFLLRPSCPAGDTAQLSFVTALAVSAAIGHFNRHGHEKTLKWPNDILIDGKKAAGILIESVMGEDGKVAAMVIGTGVNILSAPECAISLQEVSKAQVAIHPFRDQVLAEFGVFYEQWLAEGFAPIRAAWLDQAHGLGAEVKIVAGENDEQIGILKDIDETGALLLEQDGKTKAVTSGSLFFVSQEGGI